MLRFASQIDLLFSRWHESLLEVICEHNLVWSNKDTPIFENPSVFWTFPGPNLDYYWRQREKEWKMAPILKWCHHMTCTISKMHDEKSFASHRTLLWEIGYASKSMFRRRNYFFIKFCIDRMEHFWKKKTLIEKLLSKLPGKYQCIFWGKNHSMRLWLFQCRKTIPAAT